MNKIYTRDVGKEADLIGAIEAKLKAHGPHTVMALLNDAFLVRSDRLRLFEGDAEESVRIEIARAILHAASKQLVEFIGEDQYQA